MIETSQPDPVLPADLFRGEPLPPFVRGASIREAFAEALRPPAAVSVSEAATRHRRLDNPGAYSGPWRNSMTPYLVEPMDRATSRDCDELILVAPSQTAKTEVPLNVIGHAVKYRRTLILVINPTRDLAGDFSNLRVDQGMLACSPELGCELGESRSDDKVHTKTFRNGTKVYIGWAVAGQLSARPIPTVIVDELDRMPKDINREGDAVTLARKRKRTFGRNGVLIVISSPSLDFNGGVVGHYNRGSRHLRFWRCWDCREHFSPGFDFDRKPLKLPVAHFDWPKGAPSDEAAAQVVMVCPHCGAVIPENAKADLDEAGLWLPEGQRITAAGEIRGERPHSRVWSYWWSGYVSQLLTWGEMLKEYLDARAKFEKTQDEEELKACVNTTFGFPFQSEIVANVPLQIAELEARREDWDLGTVPEGVRFLVAKVDPGVRRFSVEVEGWNEHAESWVVDRFEIETTADGGELDTANVAAHWDLLVARVIRAAYPLYDDPTRELPVAAAVIDTGGIGGKDDEGANTEGVAGQAKDFRRRLFAAGILRSEKQDGWQVTLIKGASPVGSPIFPRALVAEKDDRGKVLPNSQPIWVIGVHRLKNIIDTRLRLPAPKPGKRRDGWRHFPRSLPDGYFEELTAESKVKGKWVRPPHTANESWDLAVYGEFGRLKLRTERVRDWDDAPPYWARPRPRSERAPVEMVVAAASGRRAAGRRVRWRLTD